MTVDTGVIAELEAFLSHELPAHEADFAHRTDFEACIAWQRRLNQGGWVGLHWPMEFGGRNLDLATQVACESTLSRSGAPAIGGFIGVNTVAAAIMEWGSTMQHRMLPRILSGEIVACQGFSEPGAGSDLASLRTRVRDDGDGFVLAGQKVWTSHGGDADVCLVLARSTAVNGGGRSHRGMSALLVDLDLPGVSVVPIRQLNGACEFSEIFFDDVPLPTSSLVGPWDHGWTVAMSTLAHERAAAMILATRTRAEIVSAIRGWSDQIPAARRDDALALLVKAEVLGMLAQRSVAEIGAGQPGPAQSVVKLWWSQLDQEFAELSFDLAGAGATTGLDPQATERLLFSRSSTIAAGTSEVMRTILAEQVLGLPR